jgi:hypothetical protein
MLKLEAQPVQKLLKSPETGMGYQTVEVTTRSGGTKTGIAYNAELLLFDDEVRGTLDHATYKNLIRDAKSSDDEIVDIRVIAQPTRTLGVKAGELGASQQAKDAPIEQTGPNELFKRFSAYVNDRRLQADGSLLPGTYATTAADALLVTTGTQAVARYALPDAQPNPQPASEEFSSGPNANTPIQRGTVAPAFGQPGGGVEVIFPSGTQAGTTTGPVKIPD